MNKTVCIIGAGLSGGFLASELLKKNKYKVILIDVDCLKKKFNKNNKLDIDFDYSEKFYDNINRGYGFGGTSNLWHGGYTRLDKCDLDYIDRELNYDFTSDINLYYKKVFDQFIGKKKNFYINNSETFDIFKDLKKINKKKIYIEKKPFNSRDFIKSISNKIQIIQNAVVVTVSNNINKNKIDFIECAINNKKIKIRADIFILSAGVFETPRILLQSIQEKKLNLINNNIGKNIIDHPFCKICSLKIDDKLLNKKLTTDKPFNDKFNYRTGYSFNHKKNNQILNHSFYFREYNNDFVSRYYNILKRVISFDKFFFNNLLFLTINLINFKIIFYTIKKFALKNNLFLFLNKVDLYLHCDQSLSNTSHLFLSNVYDGYGRNIPTVKIINNLKEVRDYFFLFLKNTLKSQLNLFNFKQTRNLEIFHGNHHSGSCRISNSKSKGVVDQNLKIFDINNAYICDSSILPVFGNSNPSFTLLALSKRLANHL